MTEVTWNGVVRIGGMLLSVAAAELVQRKLDTTSHAMIVRALVFFTLLVVGGLAVFAFGSSFPLMLASLWLISLARNVIGPLYNTWMNQRLDSSVRATVISMGSQVDAVGQIAGGPVVGLIGSGICARCTGCFRCAADACSGLAGAGREEGLRSKRKEITADTAPRAPNNLF